MITEQKSADYVEVFSATLSVPNDRIYSLRSERDAMDLAHTVRAEIDARIIDGVAEAALARIENRVRLRRGELAEFLEFLVHDTEMGDRFVAWKASQRILGK